MRVNTIWMSFWPLQSRIPEKSKRHELDSSEQTLGPGWGACDGLGAISGNRPQGREAGGGALGNWRDGSPAKGFLGTRHGIHQPGGGVDFTETFQGNSLIWGKEVDIELFGKP